MLRPYVIVAVLSTAALSGACSKSSSPTSPSGSSSSTSVTNYAGMVAVHTSTTFQMARVDLQVTTASASTAAIASSGVTAASRGIFPVPPGLASLASIPSSQAATAGAGTVTGTIALSTGTIPLAGTLSATGALSLQGGGVSLTGSLNTDGTLVATGASPATTLSITAVTSLSNSASGTWCGTYSVLYRPPDSSQPTQSNADKFDFFLSPTPYALGPPRYGVTGLAIDNSNPSTNNPYNSPRDITFRGTATLGANDTPINIQTGGNISAIAVGNSSYSINGAYFGGGLWSGTINGTDPAGGVATGTFFANAIQGYACP